MYKYLSITSNMQEMMIMLGSLPVCSTIFDINARLIDLNQSAINYLRINAINDYRTQRFKVLNDCKYLLSIIQELKTGKIIRNNICQVKTPDSNVSEINFSACMLNGERDLFLFQFFELKAYRDEVLPTLKTKGFKELQDIKMVRDNKNKLDIHESFGNPEIKQQLFQNFLDETEIEKLTQKYPFLSHKEIIVCGLIILKLSTPQIAILTGSSSHNINLTNYRLYKKFELNSCKELYKMLIPKCQPT